MQAYQRNKASPKLKVHKQYRAQWRMDGTGWVGLRLCLPVRYHS